MPIVYLSLGSNLGDRLSNLKSAIKCLSSFTKILKISPVYKTSPVGKINQPYFYNCIVKLSTNFSPEELLEKLKLIEKCLGRRKTKKWSPRTIDLDIIFYNRLVFKSDKLTIPHKELHRRKFVLYPLCDIAANFVHPVFKKRVCTLKKLLKDKTQKIKPIYKTLTLERL